MRYLMFIFCFVLTLNAQELKFKPYEDQIIRVEDNFAYIKDDESFVLGSSGVVYRDFNSSRSIIARVSVVEKKDKLAKLELGVFDMLEQSALPVPFVLPEAQDGVMMNFLYDRALIVAPDKQSYDYISTTFNELNFISSDILGAYLIQKSKTAPNRNDFRNVCSSNALGLIVFALDTKAKFVDCQTFTLVYEIDIPKASSTQTPFYSRISGYKSHILDFKAEKLNDYYEYYEALVSSLKDK